MPTGTPHDPAPSADPPGPGTDEFAERLLASSLGAIEVFGVYIGDRLGWYRSLVADGPRRRPSSRPGPARRSGTRASGSRVRRSRAS
ncbi:hypothetical protein NKG05_17005 [Oerskovia sp. M15]